jgi:hypothetical protein
MPPKKDNTLIWSNSSNYATSLGAYDTYSTYEYATNRTTTMNDTLQDLISQVQTLEATKVDKVEFYSNSNDNNMKKEDKKMKGFNFDFGPCGNGTVKMSLYGMAVKNATGNWVAYDKNTTNIIDVDILNFDCAKFFYKMPVAIKDVRPGDVVLHNGHAMFVINVPTNSNTISVIDPYAGESKDILLTRSPFGFDFVTKIVNLIDGMTGVPADAANPFGNLWMLMLAGDGAVNDMLPLMLMNQNGGTIDPMMMYFLLGNKGNNDILPLMLMMNANKSTHACHCGGNCACADAK